MGNILSIDLRAHCLFLKAREMAVLGAAACMCDAGGGDGVGYHRRPAQGGAPGLPARAAGGGAAVGLRLLPRRLGDVSRVESAYIQD